MDISRILLNAMGMGLLNILLPRSVNIREVIDVSNQGNVQSIPLYLKEHMWNVSLAIAWDVTDRLP